MKLYIRIKSHKIVYSAEIGLSKDEDLETQLRQMLSNVEKINELGLSNKRRTDCGKFFKADRTANLAEVEMLKNYILVTAYQMVKAKTLEYEKQLQYLKNKSQGRQSHKLELERISDIEYFLNNVPVAIKKREYLIDYFSRHNTKSSFLLEKVIVSNEDNINFIRNNIDETNN